MRLAELVGTLSMATDAGTGMPDYHSLRGATVAVRLAEVVKADDRTVADVFYLPLLAMAGCTAESHTSSEVLGDEVEFGVDTYGFDYGSASEILPAMLRSVRRGRGPIGGIVSMARAMSKMPRMVEVGRAHYHRAGRWGRARRAPVIEAAPDLGRGRTTFELPHPVFPDKAGWSCKLTMMTQADRGS
jgi:hypothetical protein